MNIGSLISFLPAVTNAQAGSVGAQADGQPGNGNPVDFFKALLQQLQGLDAGTGKPAPAGVTDPKPENTGTAPTDDGLAAFIEQLKALAGQAALTTSENDKGGQVAGKPADESGKVLPANESAISLESLQSLTPEQLAQWLQQWMPNRDQQAPPSPTPGFVATAGPTDTTAAESVAVPSTMNVPELEASPLTPEETGEPSKTAQLDEARIKSAFSQLIASASDSAATSQPAMPARMGGAVSAVRPTGLTPINDRTSSEGSGVAPDLTEAMPPDVLKQSLASLDSAGPAERPTDSAQVISSQPVPVFQAQAQAPVSREVSAPIVDARVGHPDWPQDFGQKVVWMAGQGVQSAEIRLNPPHLGPLEVRIDMSQDTATVQFASHHAAVREAIESAIPKLREMMGAQNLNLAEVNVSSQSFSDRGNRGAEFAFGQQSSGQGSQFAGSAPESPLDYADAEGVPARERTSGQGLLSIYA